MAFALKASFLRLAAISCASLLLISCGGSPAKNADGTPAEDTGDTKSAFKSVGADIGCGIASILNKDCAKGARTGAKVADKVISWVFRSLKIADGKTVNKEYEAKKATVSKTEIQPMAFTSRIETTDSAPPPHAAPASSTSTETTSESKTQAPASKPVAPIATSEVKITSNTDLVGYGDKVPVFVGCMYALAVALVAAAVWLALPRAGVTGMPLLP